MTIEPTSIEGLVVIHWPTLSDERGFFRQRVQLSELEAGLGREVHWRQTNHARSRPGVVRGFHAEPWDKCVYVARGTVLAAVADIRPESPTFGEVVTRTLGDSPGEPVSLFVSRGLANSYGVIGDIEADYLYDVSEEWHEADRLTVAWDDPDLAVTWPVADPVLSPADRANPTLRARFPDHPRFGHADAAAGTKVTEARDDADAAAGTKVTEARDDADPARADVSTEPGRA